MKTINSRSNPYIKELAKLKTKREIVDKGLFLVEGRNLVLEAIQQGIVDKLLISDEEIYSIFDIEKRLVTD